MLLAEASWLDDGDKVASIVSAILSFLSLVVVIWQARRPTTGADHRADGWRRWRPRVALICAVVAAASAALVTWVFPGRFLMAGVVVGVVACLAALLVVVSGAVAWLRSPKRLDPAVRRLLKAQLSEAEFHQYAFGSLSLPGVSLIYVEQRVGAFDTRSRKATRILDAKELVRDASSGIVIGVPGAGKSTLAAHLTGAAARWWTQARVASLARSAPFGRVIPILVPARALADADIPVALAKHWSQASVEAELFADPPFRKVHWLVVVDSLDEIAAGDVRARVIQRLGTFLASHAGCRLIVTTRALTAGELTDLTSRGAQEFQLRLFGPDELVRFATNWFTVRGGRQVNADAEATRFLAHLRSSRLTSIVRVPLLATMAILVYEADRDRILPTSRAALYNEFIWLLRGSRDTKPATPFESWLVERLDDLLAELATAHVWDGALQLLPLAIDWVAANAPARLLAGPESERIGALRSTLIASGLCVFAPLFDSEEEAPDTTLNGQEISRVGNDVEFIHFTIAEYLAADPERYEFSYDSFRELMANGSTRGFALFALARGRTEPSKIVGLLLSDDDPVGAGHVIADGITVDGELRWQVIDRLLDRVTHDHPTVSDCVAVLTEMANASDVEARLRATIVDENQALWTRVVLADAFADVAAETGLDLLRSLTGYAHGAESDASWWARQRLAARAGHTIIPEEQVPAASGAPSLGEIGRQAYRQTAADHGLSPGVRAHAAGILYAAGDDVGAVVLREIALDRRVAADLRLSTARTLAASWDPQGLAALRALAETGAEDPVWVPAAVRCSAAADLMTHEDLGGVEVVRRLVCAQDIPVTERHQLAVLLVERGDPLGRSIIAELDRAHARRSMTVRAVGVFLAVLGPAMLTWVAADYGRILGAPVVIGISGIALAMIVLWLPGTGVPISAVAPSARTPRTRRGSAYGVPQTKMIEHLAAQISGDLAARSAAATGGTEGFRVHARLVSPDPANPAETLARPLDLINAPSPLRAGPVVILGPPGSGKTHLITTAALELLGQRGIDDPVPVLLPLSTWDVSAHDLTDWIADELARMYMMPLTFASNLVAEQRILPILDGLDEVHPAQQHAAAAAIGAIVAQDRNVVVTCRAADYRDLSAELNFHQATIVEMQPVQAVDLAAYIRANVTDDEFSAWQSVIRELQLGASGPFADIMANPLTATLALRPYLGTGRSPRELLRRLYARDLSDATPASILFEDYVPSAVVKMDRYPPHRSIAWLRTIALHMLDEGTDQFAWWSLRKRVPTQSMNVLLSLVIGLVVLMTVGAGFAAHVTRPPTVVAAAVMILGLAIVATQTPQGTPSGPTPQASLARATINAVGGTLTLSAGCGLLAYAATGRLDNAMVLAVVAVGFGWTTHAGQYLLILLYFARAGLLPARLMVFLDATTRAHITTELGPVYRFVHAALREALIRNPVP